jgi:hypothetical protein
LSSWRRADKLPAAAADADGNAMITASATAQSKRFASADVAVSRRGRVRCLAASTELDRIVPPLTNHDIFQVSLLLSMRLRVDSCPKLGLRATLSRCLLLTATLFFRWHASRNLRAAGQGPRRQKP